MTPERIAVCPDTHRPFHDKRAWACFLEACCVAEVNRIVLIGDFADFWRVSRYFKSPRRKESFFYEVEDVNVGLDEVQDLGVPVDYRFGNHEHRYNVYLEENAPELLDIAPSLPELFRLKERGITWGEYGEPLKVGHIRFVHDVGPAGVTAMQRSLASFGDSLVFGHTHRLGVMYAGTVNGDRRVTMNVGWLGDFSKVDYLKKHQTKDWSHGFGIVDIDDRGVGYCQAIPIINGRAMVDGKVVRV